jgi:hypothetical protein
MIPVYNDWAAITLLLPLIDDSLASANLYAMVVLVNDASSDPVPDNIIAFHPRAIVSARLLNLRRNLGHQRAIAVGLTHIQVTLAPKALVIMDGDGEDDPSDIPRLYAAMNDSMQTLTFAARRKRSEGALFRFFYWLYRFIHLLVTGIPVNVGNFSVVPSSALQQLVVVSELWNHYAAAVFRARIPYKLVATKRANRIAGESTMNFVGLVGHGFSALAVHGERVGVRLLVAAVVPLVTLVLLFGGITLVSAATSTAIPPWVASGIGTAAVVFMQLLVLVSMFTMFTLYGRTGASFIPLRDYHFFIAAETAIAVPPGEFRK